jgi:hypothetical protein
MAKRIDSFSGKDAYEQAKKKARFGHCDWVVWTDRHGISQARRVSPASVKECLLSTGTKGRWSLIGASDGIPMVCGWRIGVNIIAQFKYGIR